MHTFPSKNKITKMYTLKMHLDYRENGSGLIKKWYVLHNFAISNDVYHVFFITYDPKIKNNNNDKQTATNKQKHVWTNFCASRAL